MRVTREVSDLTGFNESPIAGQFITSSERDFVNRHVVAGVSVLYNKTTGLSAVVSNVTATRIDATGLDFKPGDLFLVTLSTDWLVQNSDGPVVDVECKRCGWSYPSDELVNGRCKTCVDDIRPT